MSELHTYQIQELKREVRELRTEVSQLKSERDQWIGMSNAAKWGFRVLIVLAGTGGIASIHWFLKWLRGAM